MKTLHPSFTTICGVILVGLTAAACGGWYAGQWAVDNFANGERDEKSLEEMRPAKQKQAETTDGPRYILTGGSREENQCDNERWTTQTRSLLAQAYPEHQQLIGKLHVNACASPDGVGAFYSAPDKPEIGVRRSQQRALRNRERFAARMTHEFAHLQLGHVRTNDSELFSAQEQEADRVSMKALRNVGVSPCFVAKQHRRATPLREIPRRSYGQLFQAEAACYITFSSL